MNKNKLCDEEDLLEETRISEGYLKHASVGPTSTCPAKQRAWELIGKASVLFKIPAPATLCCMFVLLY